MSNYDPGDLYDPPPRRRRPYGQENEIDDAWAAADEDDLDDPGADIEDLAAGYHWEERDQYGLGHSDTEPAPDLGPLPSRPPRRGHFRPPVTPVPSVPARRDPGPRRLNAPGRLAPQPFHMPFWQILLLVILGVMALFAVVLAVVSVLTL